MPVLLSFSYSIISIHALLAESDEFQSVGIAHLFISIHALLAESDLLLCLFLRFLSRISIHALLAESDRHRAAPTRPGWAFLSTLSLRRATTQGRANAARMGISIHALLAESDRHWQMGHSLTRQFLSTLSLRRATFAALYDILKLFPISIHALLAESDLIVSLLVSMSY